MTWLWVALLLASSACGHEEGADSGSDAMPTQDAARGIDASIGLDAMVEEGLSRERTRLLGGLAEPGELCATFASLDASQQAVFLTLTHRLFVSRTPDGLSMLEHMNALYLIAGGGSEGTECGGTENNRLFLSMDAYLWQLMLDTSNDLLAVGDGAEGLWRASTDLAGPHAPFDASTETETGLRCALLLELPSSRPPTAQLHFFRAGSELPIQRGSAIDLPSDPYMVEIDHDFDCLHRSNPICPGKEWEADYVQNYGDYAPLYQPPGC